MRASAIWLVLCLAACGDDSGPTFIGVTALRDADGNLHVAARHADVLDTYDDTSYAADEVHYRSGAGVVAAPLPAALQLESLEFQDRLALDGQGRPVLVVPTANGLAIARDDGSEFVALPIAASIAADAREGLMTNTNLFANFVEALGVWTGTDGVVRILLDRWLYEIDDIGVARALPVSGSCSSIDCYFVPSGDRSGDALAFPETSLRTFSCDDELCSWSTSCEACVGSDDYGGSSVRFRRSVIRTRDRGIVLVQAISEPGTGNYPVIASWEGGSVMLSSDWNYEHRSAARPDGGFVVLTSTDLGVTRLHVVDPDGSVHHFDEGSIPGIPAGPTFLDVVVENGSEVLHYLGHRADDEDAIRHVTIDLATGLARESTIRL